ncbi:non-specific lipid transfer protein GPI-anchored 3 [Ricinus communis]|uniref:Lipid binding protein, putative n=1 Tax=Ricinus communis TaxID=3988 RepID=B9SXR9_RICCO|nr:non-specific lipid transfer protein GPI-anchored 3 [Ricinus communis]EEF31589.1 lipid binding protein, putative [Ricinus communis]|eukprot:XP_002530788.1 non-specific lipid-transfer protein-like protein At5g64080 [Ricinus communis]
MDSKFFTNLFMLFLFFSSRVSLGFSQDLKDLSQTAGGLPQEAGTGGGDGSQCVQKLLPCKDYLRSATPPPPTCCMPLKEMVANEAACLCSVITNPGILKSFNITEQDALNLAKTCGANADLSTCKHDSPSPASPAVTPPAANSSTNSSSPDKKSAGHKMYNLERTSFTAFFVALMFLAFSV